MVPSLDHFFVNLLYVILSISVVCVPMKFRHKIIYPDGRAFATLVSQREVASQKVFFFSEQVRPATAGRLADW